MLEAMNTHTPMVPDRCSTKAIMKLVNIVESRLKEYTNPTARARM
jgi:hypothetical protein